MFRRVVPAALVAAALALSACGAPGSQSGDSRLKVVASFYPLQYVAMRIGGDRVSVTSLTKPGAEPHDLELTPQDVAALADTDLVVYLKGFQPAVDEAVSSQAGNKAFDATASAELDLTYTPVDGGQQGDTDPHFWLDPVRLRAVVADLTERMAQADPTARATFETNSAALDTDLAALDREFRAGLARCADRTLVTSHNAFGYLAELYGLRQVGITGLSPDSEPDAGRLAEVSSFVRKQGVRTIYYETLVSPAVADTVARETGAATAVLDPLEGLNDRSPGKDYFEVMRANLASLKKGQDCR